MPGNGDHGMGKNFEKSVSGPSRVQRMYLGANTGRGVAPDAPLRMFITPKAYRGYRRRDGVWIRLLFFLFLCVGCMEW